MHGEQIGRILEALEPLLENLQPDVVYVQGDTNSVLAGAFTANRLGIAVAHVEAGLRSYDRRMPEETNRILADHLSDYLLAPTPKARRVLLGEGFPDSRIYVTGNTVVDAVLEISRLCDELPPLHQRWKLTEGGFILLTLHRPENVDYRDSLLPIIEAVQAIGDKYGMPVVFPVHPRTAKCLEQFGISLGKPFLRLGPVDYLQFVQLEKNASMVITDSGGVQEEACVLGVPCVTVRLTTERTETVEAGANILAGVERDSIIAGAEKMMKRTAGWKNPLGDGKAGERIVEIVMDQQTGCRSRS